MSYNFINKIQPNEAITSLNPTAEYVVRGGDKGIDACSIEWLNDTPAISKADIKTEINRLQTEFDNKEYQRKRKAEYPAIGDQLDYIYHNGLTKWKADMITPVKEKYPK